MAAVTLGAEKVSACGALRAVQTKRWHLGRWVALRWGPFTAGMQSSEVGKVGHGDKGAKTPGEYGESPEEMPCLTL